MDYIRTHCPSESRDIAYVSGALRDMFGDFFEEVENNGQQHDGCGVLIDHLDFMEKH